MYKLSTGKKYITGRQKIPPHHSLRSIAIQHCHPELQCRFFGQKIGQPRESSTNQYTR